MNLALPLTAALFLSSVTGLTAQSASWIWHGQATDRGECYARLSFDLKVIPKQAGFAVSCDNHADVFLNGKKVLSSNDWAHPEHRDITKRLRKGVNVIAVLGRNEGGPAALAARIDLTSADGKKRSLVTDKSWRSAGTKAAGWKKLGFDDSAWGRPVVLGTVGQQGLPWTSAVTKLSTESHPLTGQRAVTDPKLEVKAGFRAERVFTVPRQMGSLVSITSDDRGRLFVSDQKSGLYRVTPATIGDPAAETRVERIEVDLGGAQGLLWAFDSLYVVVNGRGSGLYRLRDSDGDDKLDHVELLRKLKGGGEHGPHAVILAPDGKSLYVCAGNHTTLTDIETSRLPQNWGEDLLLPRQWDANGHARGRLAPGGWICHVDPEGKTWTLVGSGFRNEYDIALDRNGELFSYDADMEWDMGMPWYRPTRVCHVISGAEFGWRAGTGKWPVSYPDSVPPVIDIGPGSPTGIAFGTNAAFPQRYQRALYILDWTFGTIYALHMQPNGSGYTAEKEEFVSSKPLPVTDVAVAGDGALYFTTGGRGAASAIYRVIYTGSEDVSPDQGEHLGQVARDMRHKLESFHGRQDPRAVDAAWPYLRNPGPATGPATAPDRLIRYAARLAIEAQPLSEWRDRALAEKGTAAIYALLALARQGEPSDRSALFGALEGLSSTEMSAEDRIAYLRVHALGMIRLGRPDRAQRARLIDRLDAQFPSGDDRVDSELCRLSVYLGSKTIVAKVITKLKASTAPGHATKAPAWAELIGRNDRYGAPIRKMLANMPPLHGIDLAFMLRTARVGWTMPLRRSYFEFIREASQRPGGNSYRGFLNNMRYEALENCTAEERVALADLTGVNVAAKSAFEVSMPKGPGRAWTVDSALLAVEGHLKRRSYDAGRNLFHATACAACHRFDGEGGSIGPDLTSVSHKYTLRDVLESIVEPSSVISDQYGAAVVHKKDGSQLHGIVVESGMGARAEVAVYTLDPKAAPTRVRKADVDKIEVSTVSQMPPGLIFSLNPDELRDLCAYLLSGGNRKDRMFAKKK